MPVTVRRARGAPVLLALLAWLLVPLPAAAHAELQATFPEAGASLSSSPQAVAARFSEALAGESSIDVVAGDGTVVAAGGIDPEDGRRLIAALESDLAPGTYEVRWRAFGSDGHLERGTFGFTVLAPTPPPATLEPTSATATPDPSPSATALPTEVPLPSPAPDDAPASDADVVIPIVAALLVLAGLGLWLLRGRRRGRA
ncbi:MAG TPA: copper resistance protein CopC [Vitreimonas sp.]|nr:copper resistance protein CopC [Vitreimonas sp.]